MHSPDEARERAALHAAGALSADEQYEFETHLSGCPPCRAERDAFIPIAARLGEVSRQRQPRPELRQAVLEAVEKIATGSAVSEGDGTRFVRTQQLPWEGARGGALHVKRLNRDPQGGHHSLLIHLAPGQTYPRHRHADVEEVFLVEGDLTLNGVTMHVGDYCRAEPGSIHSTLSTVHGCTFIAFASDHDEILP